MFKSRFILVLAVLLLVLTTVAVSNPKSNVSLATNQDASDFHQRHPDWQWVAGDQTALIPLTGDAAFPDYHQRHPEFSVPVLIGLDASDYFQRHPELTAPAGASVDRTDYYFRHPELTTPLTESLETPDLACESPVDCR